MNSEVIALDLGRIKVKSLYWFSGSPYDPRGIYALVEIDGEARSVFVKPDGRPEQV